MSEPVSGTEGYAQETSELFARYETIPPADVHRAVLHLLPKTPSRVADIGSGSGRDAAWFAEMGHRVVAVEPTDALRVGAIARHSRPAIEWVNDSLPDLSDLRSRNETFDLVMLTAVWMHLDENQRGRAMPNVASLTATGGLVIMKLRHGPIPPGRRMFEVSPEETIELAGPYGLRSVLNVRSDSVQAANRSAGVRWSTIALAKAP
ncbi:class I SAM-dependent methyltransferase [Bradyrhizobium sp. UFLA05-112]